MEAWFHNQNFPENTVIVVGGHYSSTTSSKRKWNLVKVNYPQGGEKRKFKNTWGRASYSDATDPSKMEISLITVQWSRTPWLGKAKAETASWRLCGGPLTHVSQPQNGVGKDWELLLVGWSPLRAFIPTPRSHRSWRHVSSNLRSPKMKRLRTHSEGLWVPISLTTSGAPTLHAKKVAVFSWVRLRTGSLSIPWPQKFRLADNFNDE